MKGRPRYRSGLFQLGRDRRECGVELGPDAGDRGDNNNRNSSRDQSVLNRRSRCLVFEESAELLDHSRDVPDEL